MRLASYNIMSGGFDGYNAAAGVPVRLSALQAAVAALDVDCLGLIDTFRWDKLYSQQQIGEWFGYKYVKCVNLKDDRQGPAGTGIALLSRRPWLECRKVRIATRDALLVTFDVNSQPCQLALVYLDDISNAVRTRQMTALLAAMTAEPAIIMGDLNTVAAGDVAHTARAVRIFLAANPSIQPDVGPALMQMLHGDSIGLAAAQGFIDAGVRAGATMPTRLFPAQSERPFLRIDYCLHRDVDVRDFRVHNSTVLQRASDHLPVSFEVG